MPSPESSNQTTNGPDHNNQEPSPFSRPAWIVSAAVLAVILVLGIVLIISNMRGRPAAGGASSAPAAGRGASATPAGSAPTPGASPASTSRSPSPSPTAADPNASVCGLATDLSGAPGRPRADWKYQGTTAYPSSATYGPAKTSPKGYRYCFAHSATGALFAAANAMVQSSGGGSATWATYFVGKGPYRSHILHGDNGTATGDVGSTRMRLDGYRMLSFSPTSARVDLAYDVTATQGTITASVVQSLVWQAGDWHYSADSPQPINVGRIPDLTGYTRWGEG